MKYYLIDYDYLQTLNNNPVGFINNYIEKNSDSRLYIISSVSSNENLKSFFTFDHGVTVQVTKNYTSLTQLLNTAKEIYKAGASTDQIAVYVKPELEQFIGEQIKQQGLQVERELAEQLKSGLGAPAKQKGRSKNNNNNNNNNQQDEKIIDQVLQAIAVTFNAITSALNNNAEIKDLVNEKLERLLIETKAMLAEEETNSNKKNSQELASPAGARLYQLFSQAIKSALADERIMGFLDTEISQLNVDLFNQLEAMLKPSSSEVAILKQAVEKQINLQSKSLLDEQLQHPQWQSNKVSLAVIIDELNQCETFPHEICSKGALTDLRKSSNVLLVALIGETAPKDRNKAAFEKSAEELGRYLKDNKTILMNIIGNDGVEKVRGKIQQRLLVAQVLHYIRPQIELINRKPNGDTRDVENVYFLGQQLNKLAVIIEEKVKLYGNQKSGGSRQKNPQDMVKELEALNQLYEKIHKLRSTVTNAVSLNTQINNAIEELKKDSQFSEGIKKHGAGFGLSKAEQYCKEIVEAANALDIRFLAGQRTVYSH